MPDSESEETELEKIQPPSFIDEKKLTELRSMLPKARKTMSSDEVKKELFTLDQWVDRYDDESWRELAYQSKLLWSITRSIKEFSDMTWKVAVTGAFTVLTGASKRQTYVYTLQEKVRLNMWPVVLGPSGITRKSTTRRRIYDILLELNYVNFIPIKITPEALYEELKRSPNAVVLADELGSFFKNLKGKKYMEGMSDDLSDIYDCKDILEKSTKTGGRTTIRNPYLRLYGGGTESVIKNLDDELFEQGFLPRFHFILDFDDIDNRKFKYIGKPNPHLEREISKITDKLKKFDDLKVEALLYDDIPQEFIDYQDYCFEKLRLHVKRGDSITAPYYARMPFHALKMAGLLYLADLVDYGTDYKVNILPSNYIILGSLFMRLYEEEYLNLVYRYKSSAPSGHFDTQEKKLSHVENLLKLMGGACSHTELLKESKMEKRYFDSIIETLVENETIKRVKITKKLLVELEILKNEEEPYPFVGRPPETLVWHIPSFEDEKNGILKWIEDHSSGKSS